MLPSNKWERDTLSRRYWQIMIRPICPHHVDLKQCVSLVATGGHSQVQSRMTAGARHRCREIATSQVLASASRPANLRFQLDRSGRGCTVNCARRLKAELAGARCQQWRDIHRSRKSSGGFSAPTIFAKYVWYRTRLISRQFHLTIELKRWLMRRSAGRKANFVLLNFRAAEGASSCCTRSRR